MGHLGMGIADGEGKPFPVARELAPAGARSGPLYLPDTPSLSRLSWGRFAAQREQAPSPQDCMQIREWRANAGPLLICIQSNFFPFRKLGDKPMRISMWVVATFLLAAVSLEAQARALTQNQQSVCRWGSDIAAGAQASKLSGVSLYGARKKLQVRKFPPALDAHDCLGHYRADLQQRFASQAGCGQADLLRAMCPS